MMKLPKIEQGLEEIYEGARGRIVGLSQWVEGDGVKVYLRVSKRFVEDSYPWGVTIASIDVSEKLQRQGRFKALLVLCEEFIKRHDLAFVYVESVINEDLLAFLLTQGFKPRDERYAEIIGGDFYRLKG